MEKCKTSAHKKRRKTTENPSSYRSLCMLNITGKLLEKIIDNRLREYMEETDGFTHSQYGFRQGKSTIDALSKLNDIVKNKGRKNYVGMLTIDVKNTFNSAPWGRILESVSKKSIPSFLCRIIESYFADR